jgi:hypothetical protein
MPQFRKKIENPKYCHALGLVETTGGHGPVSDDAF